MSSKLLTLEGSLLFMRKEWRESTMYQEFFLHLWCPTKWFDPVTNSWPRQPAGRRKVKMRSPLGSLISLKTGLRASPVWSLLHGFKLLTGNWFEPVVWGAGRRALQVCHLSPSTLTTRLPAWPTNILSSENSNLKLTIIKFIVEGETDHYWRSISNEIGKCNI